MKKYYIKFNMIYSILIFAALFPFLAGCKKDPLDPKNPVTLTVWHVYGSQTFSPMNDMIDEFNDTVGKERGIRLSVTSVSNSTDIHNALMAAANREAGAGDLPDIFFCYPETAGIIGSSKLIDWNTVFTENELSQYVRSFLDEGTIDGKLLVFPVAKSSEALFVNSIVFDRFSKDTGVTYDSLSTWEGLFDAAEKYYTWSGGKTFFMFDDILHFVQINAAAKGGDVFKDGSLNFDDPVFKEEFIKTAEAAITGRLRVEANYETTVMMTGGIVCGIGSTASIMYFQDTATYPDNTKEPLVIKALPYPVPANGGKLAIQQGVGMSAVAGDARKEAAAMVFTKWITQGDANLRFVSQSGYMPVQNTAFEAIENFSFINDSYRGLYESIKIMRDTYKFYLPPVVDGYYEILNTFYYSSIDILNESKTKFESPSGTAASNVEALARDSYERLRNAMK